jgi:hypothetical protein
MTMAACRRSGASTVASASGPRRYDHFDFMGLDAPSLARPCAACHAARFERWRASQRANAQRIIARSDRAAMRSAGPEGSRATGIIGAAPVQQWLVEAAALIVWAVSRVTHRPRAEGGVPASRTLEVTVDDLGGGRWERTRDERRETLHLGEGAVQVTVPHQPPGRRFLVALPDGELEVRGTRFTVETRGGRTERMVVFEAGLADSRADPRCARALSLGPRAAHGGHPRLPRRAHGGRGGRAHGVRRGDGPIASPSGARVAARVARSLARPTAPRRGIRTLERGRGCFINDLGPFVGLGIRAPHRRFQHEHEDEQDAQGGFDRGGRRMGDRGLRRGRTLDRRVDPDGRHSGRGRRAHRGRRIRDGGGARQRCRARDGRGSGHRRFRARCPVRGRDRIDPRRGVLGQGHRAVRRRVRVRRVGHVSRPREKWTESARRTTRFRSPRRGIRSSSRALRLRPRDRRASTRRSGSRSTASPSTTTARRGR